MRSAARGTRPRIGFLGVGWIGRNRLEALARSGAAEIVAVCDPIPENARAAALVGNCAAAESLDQLLEAGLDGVVIATPSGLHAEHAMAALERGVAVFCQKPLGRTGEETRLVVNAARAADRLLGVDLSYRFVEAARLVRELVRSGGLGTVYAADLVFHNGYGPDKPWFYDPVQSGGGCVIDLGIHLVDLALWVLGQPAVDRVSSRLFAKGEALSGRADAVEDYAVAQLELETGGVVRLACSWNLPVGRDAVIEARFFGNGGGAQLSNVAGSFYDFRAERFRGTSRETLCTPPDDWGGRAALDWVRRLACGGGFDPSAEELIQLANVVDRIYGRARTSPTGERLQRRLEIPAGLAGGV